MDCGDFTVELFELCEFLCTIQLYEYLIDTVFTTIDHRKLDNGPNRYKLDRKKSFERNSQGPGANHALMVGNT